MRSLTASVAAMWAAWMILSSTIRADDEWSPLFNGRNLTGWYVCEEGGEKRAPWNDRLVRVEDGAMHFYPDGGETLSKRGYVATETGYSFFRLRFEYRWGEATAKNRDSGVLVHIADEDVIWPTSVQCQIKEGKTAELVMMGVAQGVTAVVPQEARDGTPVFRAKNAGGERRVLGEDDMNRRVARSGGVERDGWNQVELTVTGGTVTCSLNGEVVNYVTDLRRLVPIQEKKLLPLTAGRIAIQAESSEVFYRNIEVQPIWGGPLDVPERAFNKYVVPQYNRPEFVLPRGYEIELAVAQPILKRPMTACFDDAGNLYVCEAAGVNLFGDDLETAEPNAIYCLRRDPNVRNFQSSRLFADGLTFPTGCAWYGDSLYVTSAPYIWRLRDVNRDGRADERTPLVGTFNDSGIGDSLHGPFFAPDGRMYWTHGIGGGGHEVRDAEGDVVVKSEAPGVFSCWPDGTDIRKHCAGGMNNPVEIDFTDAGQMIGTVNLLKNSPRDDALVHWMWGGLYPHNQRMIEGLPRTGELLDSTFSFGQVAVSGLARLRTDYLGGEYRDSFLVTQFNTRKVVRVNLKPHGSTYTGEAREFLSTANTDVHFTDVLEDADGSVLVVDTGGWFRNGCPTSQLAKPDVLGGVYRIRRTEAPTPAEPWGGRDESIWQPLKNPLGYLNDPREGLRDRAINALAAGGVASLPGLKQVLTQSPRERERLAAVWSLCRMRDSAAASVLELTLNDSSPIVREAAVHAIFCRRDVETAPSLIKLLGDESRSVRRETATTLGVLHAKEAVPGLLAALSETNDRLLEHALMYALIEINDPEQTLAGLAHASPMVKRGALIALDQMPAGGLKQVMMAPLLDTVDPPLQQTALEIISRRAGWAEETIGVLDEWLAGGEPLSGGQSAALRGALTAFAGDAKVQELVASVLTDDRRSVDRRLLVLEAIGRMQLAETPKSWPAPLAALVRADDPSLALAALAAVKNVRDPSLDAAVSDVARGKQTPLAQRLAAIETLVDRGQPLDDVCFTLLTAEFMQPSDDDGARPERLLQIARTLAKAPLPVPRRRAVAALVANSSPLTLPVLLGAFDGDADADTGQALIAALEQSESRSSLPAMRLEQALRAYPEQVHQAAVALLASSRAEAAKNAALLNELNASLESGDAARGRAVFFGNKAACSACHRRESQGGSIGPDLSRIGRIRTRRDLLEAVMFPSASFARGFEPITIATVDGLTHQGVIGGETGREITLRTGDRAEIRIPRDQIEEMQPSALSIMPQGLDTALTREELRDLLAYLATAQ